MLASSLLNRQEGVGRQVCCGAEGPRRELKLFERVALPRSPQVQIAMVTNIVPFDVYITFCYSKMVF